LFEFTASQQSTGVNEQGQFAPQLPRIRWLIGESKHSGDIE
jgi:hypothetical protein